MKKLRVSKKNLLGVFCLFIYLSIYSQPLTVTINTPSVMTEKNYYDVPIMAANFNNVGGFQFDIQYNSRSFILEDVTASVRFDMFTWNRVSGGEVSIIGIQTNTPINFGKGVLLLLKFWIPFGALTSADKLSFSQCIVNPPSGTFKVYYYDSPSAAGGIFVNNSTLSVKFHPSVDMIGVFNSGKFGIRWLTALGAGVTLSSESSSFGYVRQGVKATSGDYDYQIFSSTASVASATYTAGTEYTLMTANVTGGAGTGTFELSPSGFADDAGKWSIVIGGNDKAPEVNGNWYYQSSIGTVPLPVELVYFRASVQGDNSVYLLWETASECNNFGFEIERKEVPSGSWNRIGFVAGAGTSSSPKKYEYCDAALFPGLYSYRLKQIDNDGYFKYSGMTEAASERSRKRLALLNNFPNPFNPVTQIRFSVPEDGYVALKVYNLLGQEVSNVFGGIVKGGMYSQATFNAVTMPSGIYFAAIKFNGKSMVHRMLMSR